MALDYVPKEVRGYQNLIRYLRTVGIRTTYPKLKRLVEKNGYKTSGAGIFVFPNYTTCAIVKDLTGVDAKTYLLAHKMVKEGVYDPDLVEVDKYPEIEWSREVPLYVAVCTNGVRETVLRDYRNGKSYITFERAEAELWDISWCKRDAAIYGYDRGTPHDPSFAKAAGGLAKLKGSSRTELIGLRIVLVNDGDGTKFATAPARMFSDWNQGLCNHDAPFVAAFSQEEFKENLKDPLGFFDEKHKHHEWYQYHHRRKLRPHTLELWRSDFSWLED